MFESLARLGDDPLFLGGFPMMEMEDEAAARWLSDPSKCTLLDLLARSFRFQKITFYDLLVQGGPSGRGIPFVQCWHHIKSSATV